MNPMEDPAGFIDRMGAQAGGMAEKIKNIVGTGADDDELVTATCGPGGQLVDIEFSAKSRRLDTHELKDRVLVAVQRAGQAATGRLTEVIAEFSAGFGGAAGPGGTGTGLGDLQKSMDEARSKIDAQRVRLEEMYADLQKRP